MNEWLVSLPLLRLNDSSFVWTHQSFERLLLSLQEVIWMNGASTFRISLICRWYWMMRPAVIGLGCSLKCLHSMLSIQQPWFNVMCSSKRTTLLVVCEWWWWWCRLVVVSSLHCVATLHVTSFCVVSSRCVSSSSCRRLVITATPYVVYSCCWCRGFVFLHHGHGCWQEASWQGCKVVSIVMMAMMIEFFNVFNVHETTNWKERQKPTILGRWHSPAVESKQKCTSAGTEITTYVFSLVRSTE